MRRSGRARALAMVLAAAVVAAVVAAVAGCTTPPAETLPPKIAPPAIKQVGVLRAGVELSYPPFAGSDQGEKVGIDVDVASALAGRLGLKVELVDVKSSAIATALAHGDVDVALSAPFSADILARGTMAGTYLSDGPALFTRDATSSVPTTGSISALEGTTVGAEQGSEAYWLLVGELGPDGVTAYPSLRDAFDALARGDVDSVAGDALVGAYMIRDQPGVHYVGALAPAHLLGIAVAADNARLADMVRPTVERLASDGVLDAIRSAWVGRLPKLPLPSSEASDALATSTLTP